MSGFFRCPRCHSSIDLSASGSHCASCGEVYDRDESGYVRFIPTTGDPGLLQADTTEDAYAHTQETSGPRLYDEYLKPRLFGHSHRRVLDAGCGVGGLTNAMIADGHDAFGVDLPSLAPKWKGLGNDPDRFFSADAVHLPFHDSTFDAVVCFGVIEHIGERLVPGTRRAVMSPEYWRMRELFVAELLRVVGPNGSLILSAPNRSFPVDLQHAPMDDEGLAGFRRKVFERSGMNFHKTWGRHHLVSYRDVSRLAGRATVEPLPLEGFFGFSLFETGRKKVLKPVVERYLSYVSGRASALNPYVLVKIEKLPASPAA